MRALNAPSAPKSNAPNPARYVPKPSPPRVPAFIRKTPAQKGFITPPGMLDAVVWCERGRHWLIHGAKRDAAGNPPSPGESGGLRDAHCPHYRSYELIIAGPASPAMLRDMRRRRPRGPAWILAEMVAETVNDSLAETVL